MQQDRGWDRFCSLSVCGRAVLTPSKPERSSCALCPKPCTRSPSHRLLLAARLAWQEEGDRQPALGLSHLRQLIHPLSLNFPHLQKGDTNGTHPQGIPGVMTQDLPTRSQLSQRTSWDFSVWVCPFQLLNCTPGPPEVLNEGLLHEKYTTGPQAPTAQTHAATTSEPNT